MERGGDKWSGAGRVPFSWEQTLRGPTGGLGIVYPLYKSTYNFRFRFPIGFDKRDFEDCSFHHGISGV